MLSSISRTARLILAGIKSKFLNLVFLITSSGVLVLVNASKILEVRLPFSTPTPVVELPCGSISTNNTFLSNNPKDAAKFILVVVFPTPPFWLTNEIILPILTPT